MADPSEEDFEDPVGKSSTADSNDANDDFEPEDPDNSEEDMFEEAGFGDIEAEAIQATFDLKEELTAALFSRETPVVEAMAAPDPGTCNNIVGFGLGYPEIDFESTSMDGPGGPVINVYVVDRAPIDMVKATLVDQLSASKLMSDSVPINIVPVGSVEAYSHTHRERPAPCGISAGNFRISAGTLGVLARGRRGARRNRILALSNNHVFAASNAGRAGDAILQPGAADQGRNPQDRIAILEKWVPIKFGNSDINYVDCATGWCWSRRVRRDFLYRSTAGSRYFRVNGRPVRARTGMMVGKSGRTTGLTLGRIYDTSANIRVNFGRAGVANFRDQITVRGNRGDFSRPGDSGSLIWSWDRGRSAVGLLFAGGNGYTFGNKIHRVLDALDIQLYT